MIPVRSMGSTTVMYVERVKQNSPNHVTNLYDGVVRHRHAGDVYTVAKETSLDTRVLHTGRAVWGTPTVNLTHLSLLAWIGTAWLMNGL